MPFGRTADTSPRRLFALAFLVGAIGLSRALHDGWVVSVLALLSVLALAALVLARRPSHDEADRARVVASAALAAVAGAMVVPSWTVSYEGLTHFAPLAGVVVTSALLAGGALAHDRGRRAWLARLFQGQAEGWAVVPADGAAAEVVPFVRGAAGGAAIVAGPGTAAPFRREGAPPLASIAPQFSATVAPLRVRTALLVGVLVADVALGGALSWHRSRPLAVMRAVLQIAVGPDQTCARLVDGEVLCWGASRRELAVNGDVRTTFDWNPVVLPALAGAVDLSFGDDTVCAHDRGAQVRCERRGSPSRPPPLRPAPAAERFASSGDHACVVGDDGTVRCHGSNDDGELGGAPSPGRRDAVAVAGLPRRAVAVAVAHGFSCARLVDDTAWCWGRMVYGRLGHPPPLPPTPAPDLRDVVSVRVDSGSLWALRRDGRLWSWDGSPESRPLAGLASVVTLVANHDEWCALEEGGAVSCWRYGRPAERREVLRDVAALAADGGHTCALMRDTTVRCWGRNAHGQIGDGTREARPLPTEVRR